MASQRPTAADDSRLISQPPRILLLLLLQPAAASAAAAGRGQLRHWSIKADCSTRGPPLGNSRETGKRPGASGSSPFRDDGETADATSLALGCLDTSLSPEDPHAASGYLLSQPYGGAPHGGGPPGGPP
ncbi:hypothetical protein Efla_004797 [Eimeria flavescens]